MSRKLEDGTLAETLGDEAQGMVVVDYDGHPQKYDAAKIMSQFVAKEVNVLKIDIPRAGARGGSAPSQRSIRRTQTSATLGAKRCRPGRSTSSRRRGLRLTTRITTQGFGR